MQDNCNMEYLIKNKQNKRLRIIPYHEESHNEKCQIIEQNSGKESMLCGLFQVERNLKISYSNMLKQKHQNGFILVVEDMENQNLAAKVCVGIKGVMLNNKKEIACYIYDLRVDASYQRLGIGWQLTQQIEKYSIQNYNATISFCTINQSNKRSQALFQKQGKNLKLSSERQVRWGFIDESFIKQGEKLYLKQLNNKQLYKLNKSKIEDEQEIISILSNFYQNIDLFPTDYTELIRHPKSIGCYQVKEEGTGNYAAVHLFIEKQELALTLKRLFCLIKNYNTFYVQAVYCLILLLLLILFVQIGLFKLLNLIFQDSVRNIVLLLICTFITIVSYIFLCLKLLKILQMVHKLQNPYIRLSSLMYYGDSDKKQQIVLQLLYYVSQIAISQNVNFLRYNIDRRSEFVDILNKKQSPFMPCSKNTTSTIMPYKIFDKERQKLYQDYKLGKETFFDPRDV